MFGLFKKKPPPQFPPVPKWRPTIVQPLEKIVERVAHYTNHVKDFAVFEHGTCVLIASGLGDGEASAEAKTTLAKIFNAHPDMNPVAMKDGNITVQYNHPALNVVLSDVAESNWVEIDRSHQDALATSEVLITPMGQNKLDDLVRKHCLVVVSCLWTLKILMLCELSELAFSNVLQRTRSRQRASERERYASRR